MALVKVDFYSRCLGRTVNVSVALPCDKNHGGKRLGGRRGPFKTLYLLHGLFGSDADWLEKTNVCQYAEDRDLALVMPSGENGFYVDKPESGGLMGTFIGKELVEVTRDLFPLSERREDTFIGGLSMGAYTAVINGLLHPETFGRIIVLSGGFILDRATPVPGGEPITKGKQAYFEGVFGDLAHLRGSEKDYNAVAERLAQWHEEAVEAGRVTPDTTLPYVYIACGADDTLIEKNRGYARLLSDLGYPVTYYESDGGVHNWEFWEKWVLRSIDWLPLGPASRSEHSVDYSQLGEKRSRKRHYNAKKE